MPKKCEYIKSNLELAIREVQSGTSSYRVASKKYGIPKSTIEFKIKNPGHKDTFGPSPILSSNEENVLVGWIKDLARKGFPRKADDITLSVQTFLNSNPRENPFKNNRPGNGWLKAFLKRHKDITERTSEAVTAASSCVSDKDIRKWFLEIDEYIKDEKLEDVIKDPARVFNGDETGFQICPSTGKVFAAKGAKNVYSIDHGSSKENITVMFTFSADGIQCCPMITYPYQRIPEKIANTVNPEWGIGRSDNGWMTAETFFQYIANVFHPYLLEKKVTLPVILFVDGHKSHLTYELSVLCKELQIEVIALYPNATRILQPADVAVFRPIKMAWRQAVREWYADHPEQVLNRISFAPLLEKVVDLSIKPETLVNGFKACGLCPFNPDAIDFSKCLGSVSNSNITDSLNPVPNISMQYNAFLNIVGKDKIEKFKSLDQVFPDDIDDNFFDLYRIWKHFESQCIEPSKNNVVHDNVEQNGQCSRTVNILQNVLIEPGTNNVRDTSAENTQSELCIQVQSLEPSTSTISPLPTSAVKVVHSELLGQYLTRPDVPQRKGIRNIERFPFAITSKKYQVMFEKKRELQETNDRKKEETRQKREDDQAAKRALQEQKNTKKGTKRQQGEIQSTKQFKVKKTKSEENKKICHVCFRMIRSKYELRCDQCTKYFHKLCVPKTHRIHIPDEEDKYLCHNCYKEDSDSDVSEPDTYNEHADEENVEENSDDGKNQAETHSKDGEKEIKEGIQSEENSENEFETDELYNMYKEAMKPFQ